MVESFKKTPKSRSILTDTVHNLFTAVAIYMLKNILKLSQIFIAIFSEFSNWSFHFIIFLTKIVFSASEFKIKTVFQFCTPS